MIDPDTLVFDAAGLIPCVAQGRAGDVRMVGWMNREALQRTLDTGQLTFWSRSRQSLWTKGETSGNRLRLIALRADCDRDTLLAIAEPEGPTCHRGTETCFEAAEAPETTWPWMERLEGLLRARKAAASLEGSYTQKLFARGTDRIAKKVVEEAGEVILAAKAFEHGPSDEHREEFLGEAADLLFHLDLLLVDAGLSLQDAVDVLKVRHAARTAPKD
ncbi:MAG: bifunctional phosphoribosyl-AMP cyclohydrolase/phosphoribosyl-ATP diphosphatase HisIE [Holophagaceae bacterium]